VDDGVGLLRADADVGLIASAPDLFVLALAGRRTTLSASPADAPALALSAARAFLELHGPAWRVRELDGGVEALAERLGAGLLAAAVSAGAPLTPGPLTQRDGRTALTALPPLARLEPPALDALAELAPEVRLSTWRTLSVLDLDQADVPSVRRELERLGLVVSERSGWEGLSACAGLGACAKARVDVRAAAARRARQRGPGDPIEHWSGCDRRCGEPANAGVTIFAAGGGLTVAVAGDERSAADVDEALELL
jgi:sulfite reductase beta subunit-like hemoprotein